MPLYIIGGAPPLLQLPAQAFHELLLTPLAFYRTGQRRAEKKAYAGCASYPKLGQTEVYRPGLARTKHSYSRFPLFPGQSPLQIFGGSITLYFALVRMLSGFERINDSQSDQPPKDSMAKLSKFLSGKKIDPKPIHETIKITN